MPDGLARKLRPSSRFSPQKSDRHGRFEGRIWLGIRFEERELYNKGPDRASIEHIKALLM